MLDRALRVPLRLQAIVADPLFLVEVPTAEGPPTDRAGERGGHSAGRTLTNEHVRLLPREATQTSIPLTLSPSTNPAEYSARVT